MAKIYTKTGDQGQTGLWGGSRVPKCDDRVEAYGTLDELNSVIGMVRAEQPDARHELLLEQIQNDLFQLGAELAATDRTKLSLKTIDETHIKRLELKIDEYDNELPPMTHFVHPGGGRLGATCHLARAVCRRGERRVVSLKSSNANSVSITVIKYLNRLGDLLFVLARVLNQDQLIDEHQWIPETD